MTAIRDIIEEVYQHHAGHISTHYESCWKYHAGCLASLLRGILDEEDECDYGTALQDPDGTLWDIYKCFREEAEATVAGHEADCPTCSPAQMVVVRRPRGGDWGVAP